MFRDVYPKARDIKVKSQQMRLHQIKKLLHVYRKHQQSKKELPVWVNIFANDTLDKGFISKIYKELFTAPHHEDKQSN